MIASLVIRSGFRKCVNNNPSIKACSTRTHFSAGLIVAAKSNHMIQQDEPELVVGSIRQLVFSARGQSGSE